MVPSGAAASSGRSGEGKGLAFVLVLLGVCDGMRIHGSFRSHRLFWEAGVPREIRQITTETWGVHQAGHAGFGLLGDSVAFAWVDEARHVLGEDLANPDST